MGGKGSGRYRYFGVKGTTDDFRFIDVRRWQRDGLLTPTQSFRWSWWRDEEAVASICVRTEHGRVVLSYRHRRSGEDWADHDVSIYLDWTGCNFGGRRPWFLCPVRGCGRRVAILYGGAIFACRQCHQLAHASQREPSFGRAARRADKIRERLGWELGFFNGTGGRPKGMHRRTFERLKAEHDAHVARSMHEIQRRFPEFAGALLDVL